MNKQEIGELINLLDAEVNNGGFDQFFFNSSGDKTAEIIDALELVGASRTAAMVKRAAAKFPEGMPPKEWAKRQDVLLEQVSPESNAFQETDKEFYSNSENLSELLNQYIAR